MSQPDVTYRGVVYPWQCDHMGHMNVMWYVGKFDEATWNFLAGIGLTSGYLKDNQRGMVAVRQETDYLSELLAGDVVHVSTTLLEVRSKVLRFRHEMHGPAELSAVTVLTGVHIDSATRRSVVLPESVQSKARDFLAEAD